MAVARLRFLDRTEEDFVHEKSVECLSEIGVLVRSQSVLKMLADAGAEVDTGKSVAKIPESMVDEAISKAPRNLNLGAREPEKDLRIPVESWPFLATTGLAIYIRDSETGEKRPSTRKDIASVIKLADALDPIDFVWTTTTANDVPPPSHGMHELWVALQNTTKHITSVTLNGPEDARNQVKLASLVAGDEERLRKRPLFSVICCSIAPLTFDGHEAEGIVELARAGIPVISMTMSLSGGSAPVTLAGTIVNGNSENLASLVITQFASPGAPHIYSSSSAPIDMMTGCINYMTVEPPLISAAFGQMAKRYGLPSMVGDWGMNDTPVPGIPHSFSQTMSVAMTTLSGTDLAGGMGGLDAVKGVSLEQMVVDSVIWENVRPFMRKFAFNDETAALDVIRAVGHGNTFLKHPHTARNFRKELFFWSREKLAWEATMSDRMIPEARRIASRLLSEHRVPPLDASVVQRGDALIRDFEQRLG